MKQSRFFPHSKERLQAPPTLQGRVWPKVFGVWWTRTEHILASPLGAGAFVCKWGGGFSPLALQPTLLHKGLFAPEGQRAGQWQEDRGWHRDAFPWTMD